MILKILLFWLEYSESFAVCRIQRGQVRMNRRILDHCSIIKLPRAILYFWVKQLGRTDQWERSMPVTWSELTNRRPWWVFIDNTPAITSPQKMTLLAKSGLNQKLTGPGFSRSLTILRIKRTESIHCFINRGVHQNIFTVGNIFCCQNIFLCRGVTVIQVLAENWFTGPGVGFLH